ncbi:MAG: antibiotic biosynthesis monooxygenase family protein [Alphaproteobacteria bacterium]
MKKGAYAVIFTNRLRDPAPGYDKTKDRILDLAENQPGFIGHTAVRDDDRTGITVSYWDSEEAIAAWKAQAEHATARRMGREKFYEWFRLEVCRIERFYDFTADD